jgi:hypothetical protein
MATEKRLIDANALVMDLRRAEGFRFDDKMFAVDIVNGQDTVDAVEAAEYDAVVEKLENLLCHATGGKYSKAGYSWEDMERMVTDYIEECCREAIDEEVGHAYWIGRQLDNFRKYEVKCSECGWTGIENYDSYVDPSDFSYCPNCGAKMDGDGNGGSAQRLFTSVWSYR